MKKKSSTWRYFIDLSGENKEKKAKCIFCDKVLSYKGGGPFTLMRHTKAVHASLMNGNSKRKSSKTKDVPSEVESNTDANDTDALVLYEENITDNVETISTPAQPLQTVDKFEVCNTYEETESIYYEESAASCTVPNSQERNASTAKQNHTNSDLPDRALPQQNFQEDEHEITGKRIGIQLKNLDSEQRIFAEKLIADVIFYGQRKRLGDESCVKINTRSETNAYTMRNTRKCKPSSSNLNLSHHQ